LLKPTTICLNSLAFCFLINFTRSGKGNQQLSAQPSVSLKE
jgi:hypothetical protein